MPNQSTDIEAVALLDEPARRALYDWVIGAGHPVSRDEAAKGVGVSRGLAAFHLDRLARAGLLRTEFRRLTGRSGPGAGRPAKLYARGERDVSVSLPDRRYELVARLLADSIERSGQDVPPAGVRATAREVGETAGQQAREEVGRRPSRRRLRKQLLDTLEDRGYQPRETGTNEIRLGNCPFHALVDEHRDLVCGMNLALAEGLIDGLRVDGATARLDPQPGWCCVVIEDTGR